IEAADRDNCGNDRIWRDNSPYSTVQLVRLCLIQFRSNVELLEITFHDRKNTVKLLCSDEPTLHGQYRPQLFDCLRHGIHDLNRVCTFELKLLVQRSEERRVGKECRSR